MPLPKRPYEVTADQVRITREGDEAVFRYVDPAVETKRMDLGSERLAAMTDEELLDFWNDGLLEWRHHCDEFPHGAREIPVGLPQVEFDEDASRWAPRGDVVRCEILGDASVAPALDEPFVCVDGHDLTLGEFASLVGAFGGRDPANPFDRGWGMRIEFLPGDELHVRPRLEVREVDAQSFTRRWA